MVIPGNSGTAIYRIDHAGPDNIGVYQCNVENIFGTERGTEVSFSIILGKKICFFSSYECFYVYFKTTMQFGEVALKLDFIHHFLYKEVTVPRQEDGCCPPFVRRVWAFHLPK